MYVYPTYRKTQKHGLCVELFSRALHTVHTHAHKHSLSHCWRHSFDACESRYFVQIASNEVQEITDQILGFSHVVFPSHFPLVLILLMDFIRSDSLWFWLSFLPRPSLSLSCFLSSLGWPKTFPERVWNAQQKGWRVKVVFVESIQKEFKSMHTCIRRYESNVYTRG